MLQVEPCTPDHLRSMLEGPDCFNQSYGIQWVPDFNLERSILEHSLHVLETSQTFPRWWTHMFVLADQRMLAGIGGYKGNPSDGTVEIGYEIAQSLQGNGYATEAARILVSRAFSYVGVATVLAHTLGVHNASTRILQKLGFEHTASFEDPDDGPIWAWEVDARRFSGKVNPYLDSCRP